MRENAYNIMALHCKWNHQSIRYVLLETIGMHLFSLDLEIPAGGFESFFFIVVTTCALVAFQVLLTLLLLAPFLLLAFRTLLHFHFFFD